MRKLFIISAILFLAFSVPALACHNPPCNNYTQTDVSGWVGTPEWSNYGQGPNGGEDAFFNGGYAAHKYDITAKGTESAYAHGEGESEMKGYGLAFQKEINHGELSGSAALTISKSHVEGIGIGIDGEDCDTGRDYANVDLEVEGTAYQSNGAFSDDRDSFIGGHNNSGVDYWAQTDNRDRGNNDRWRYAYTDYRQSWKPGYHYVGHGWYAKDIYYRVPDLDAVARDSLDAFGAAAGGTLVYAKQTNTKSFIAGVTAGGAFAGSPNSEHFYATAYGEGGIGGNAHLPNVGNAGFEASYGFSGSTYGAGIAGGYSVVEVQRTGNGVIATSSSTAFSGVTAGGNDRD